MRLLTAWGTGGVAVVVAEPAERGRVLACLRSPAGGPCRAVPGGPPVLGVLRVGDQDVDEVLVVDRGAAGLELHLHGSPVVLDTLVGHFGPLDGGATGPAVALLRGALSKEQLALALEQQAVDLGAFAAGLRGLPPSARRAEVQAALDRTRVARALAEARRLVLVGVQNAGKSTLMNRLLFRERVLAGPMPGLTRDPVQETVALQGYPYLLVDTAGEGEVAAAVDHRALDLGRAARRDAGLLLVVDGSRGPVAADRGLLQPGVLVIATKADLRQAPWPLDFPCHLRVSGLDPAGAPALRRAVGELLREWRRLPPAGPVGGPAALDAEHEAALRAALPP